MKLTVKQAIDAALMQLQKAPQGLRYMELVKLVHGSAPDTPLNTVHGAMQTLISESNAVIRPSRGLWILKKFTEPETTTAKSKRLIEDVKPKKSPPEEAFYGPFAQWLKVEADEVVEALVMGGSAFKSKWGTPDVIGVYKPRKSDFIQFPIEIVSAEIKVDPSQAVVAFGQACAYRLFSHKTYVVMPNLIAPDDESRLEALCSIYGVGLVIFSPNPETPQFAVKVKAQRFQPDLFYANEFARRLHEISKNDFDRLF